MTDRKVSKAVLIAAVGVNLLTQIGLLWLLSLWGEWRVFRFLANAQAQMDALIILCWMIGRWRDAGAREVAR